MRLIDADALKTKLDNTYEMNYGEILINPSDFTQIIEDASTVEFPIDNNIKTEIYYTIKSSDGELIFATDDCNDVFITGNGYKDALTEFKRLKSRYGKDLVLEKHTEIIETIKGKPIPHW